MLYYPVVYKVSKIVDNLTNESKECIHVQPIINGFTLTLTHPVYDEIELIDKMIPFDNIDDYLIVDDKYILPSDNISILYNLSCDEFINDFTINIGSYVRCEPCCGLKLIK